ncbi:MAG: hypothetical protein WDZ41_02400 [Candidatus Babeliales bacterium]
MKKNLVFCVILCLNNLCAMSGWSKKNYQLQQARRHEQIIKEQQAAQATQSKQENEKNSAPQNKQKLEKK